MTHVHNNGVAIDSPEAGQLGDAFHAGSIQGAWGMVVPDSTATDTLQGVDYTAAEPIQYADCWQCENVAISAEGLADGCKVFDFERQVIVDLFFVAAPNTLLPNGEPTRSMVRTYNAVRRPALAVHSRAPPSPTAPPSRPAGGGRRLRDLRARNLLRHSRSTDGNACRARRRCGAVLRRRRPVRARARSRGRQAAALPAARAARAPGSGDNLRAASPLPDRSAAR